MHRILLQPHSHDHSHGPGGHTHEHLEHPGHFHERDEPLHRDYHQRAFTVGIGGPVGSGKTALMLQLCRKLRGKMNLAAVTNDIFTKEDGEFLVRNDALPAERIKAVRPVAARTRPFARTLPRTYSRWRNYTVSFILTYC